MQTDGSVETGLRTVTMRATATLLLSALCAFLAPGCAFERPGMPSFRRAVATQRQGQYGGAIRYYQAALDVDRRFPAAHIELQDLTLQVGARDILFSYGDGHAPWQEALAERLRSPGDERLGRLRALADRAPDDPTVRFVLGEALQLAGQHEEAVRHLEAAWQLDPSLLRAAAECGWSLLELREYERAWPLFLDVVAATDDDPLALDRERRGLALLAACDRRAVEVLQLAHHATPSPRGAWLLALAELRRDQPERALEILELAFPALEVSEELYLYAVSECLAGLGEERDFAGGRALVQRALERFPRASRLWHYLADFHRAEGNFYDAEHAILLAVENNPYNPGVTRAARRQLVAAGKYEQALEIWLRGLPGLVWEADTRLGPVVAATDAVATALAAEERETLPGLLADLAIAYEGAGLWWEARSVWHRLLQAAQLEAAVIDRTVFAAAEAGHLRVGIWLDTVDALRRYFDRHYARVSGGEAIAIESVISALENICRQRVADFPAGAGEAVSMSIYGAEMSPLATPEAPLVRFFLERGLYFDLQTGRDGVELKLMTIIRRDRHRLLIEGDTLEVDGFLCGEGYIRSLAGHHAGLSRVAGCATFTGRGFYVDIEAIRASVSELASGDLLEVASRMRGLDFDPELWRHWIERFSAGLPAPPPGTSVEDWRIGELVRADIEGVTLHEIGHIIDFQHLTPFWSNLWSNLWRNVEEGFSADNLATRFELVAEAYALSQLEVPWPTLAVNLRWLKSREQEPAFRWYLRDDPAMEEPPPTYRAVADALFRSLLEGIEGNPDGPLTPLADVSEEYVREQAERLFHDLW